MQNIQNPEVIFNTIDNGIIILDDDLNIMYWNKWLEIRTKIKSSDIVGRSFLEKFSNIKESTFRRKIKSTLMLNTPSFYSVNPHNYLIDIKLNNITNKVFDSMQQSVTIVPYDLEKKQVCIYIYDNTSIWTTNFKLSMALKELEEYKSHLEEKVALEVKLNKEKDKLLTEQAKLAAMGEMIGSIAHQWRQPLNALSGYVQFLEDDYEDNQINLEYIENYITKCMELINFMSSTIDDFRNFFKINKEKTVFSIKDKILMTIKIAKAGLNKHKININISGEDFNVSGFPNEFQQVILNILSNSKDAIVSNNIKDGIIDIQIGKNGIIYMGDNAGGIEPHIISRIFEPYFTTKSDSQGTGIGLYMSKKIIEDNMGGVLSVSNNESGALFKINLSNAKLKE